VADNTARGLLGRHCTVERLPAIRTVFRSQQVDHRQTDHMLRRATQQFRHDSVGVADHTGGVDLPYPVWDDIQESAAQTTLVLFAS